MKLKTKSFVIKTLFLMAIQFFLIALVLCFFIIYFFNNSKDNSRKMSANILQIYTHELNSEIEKADLQLEEIIYNNNDLKLLKSDDESIRYFASNRINTMLNKLLVSQSNIDLLFVADDENDVYLDSKSQSISYREQQKIKEMVLTDVDQNIEVGKWRILQINNVYYLYKIYYWKGRTVGAFFDFDAFLTTQEEQTFDGMSFIIADNNDNICGHYGNDLFSWKRGGKIDSLNVNKYIENKEILHNGVGSIYLFTNISEIWKQVQISGIVLLGFIISSLLFTLIFIEYLNKDILAPMRKIEGQMKKIQLGDYDISRNEDFYSTEFISLSNTFNTLMSEIIELKIKEYEKQILLQKHELKVLSLQIRPHFFLNALTTISSLSFENKDEEIRNYIDLLSQNIRYIFKSGLHTVPIIAEINHIENYFNMQQLKYPNCVFHFINIDPSLYDWKIPQMIIHTVIENEYKYAVSMEKILTVLINITQVNFDNEDMLKIEIEDDGKFYPAEVIDNFSSIEPLEPKNGYHIGLWSISRILSLIYERNDLFRISNICPSGCKTVFLIPKKPINEIGQGINDRYID